MGTEDSKTESKAFTNWETGQSVRKKNQNSLLNWLSVYRLMVTYLEYGFNRHVCVRAPRRRGRDPEKKGSLPCPPGSSPGSILLANLGP